MLNFLLVGQIKASDLRELKLNQDLVLIMFQVLYKKIIRANFCSIFTLKLLLQKNIKAGFYEFTVGESYYSILKKLKDGKTSPVVFTIIEGQTFLEIKNRIAKSTFVKNSQFDLANTSKLAKVLNIRDHQNLEGLFYPDTYFFDYSVTGVQNYNLHMRNKKVLNSLWKKKTQKKFRIKKYESLILASIIEKETMLNNEKNRFTVFHNRLKIRMKLQADPTVIYGLREKFSGNLKKTFKRG